MSVRLSPNPWVQWRIVILILRFRIAVPVLNPYINPPKEPFVHITRPPHPLNPKPLTPKPLNP